MAAFIFFLNVIREVDLNLDLESKFKFKIPRACLGSSSTGPNCGKQSVTNLGYLPGLQLSYVSRADCSDMYVHSLVSLGLQPVQDVP